MGERRGGRGRLRSEVCRNFAWREHNFNYRSWPHCLGNVVGARARQETELFPQSFPRVSRGQKPLPGSSPVKRIRGGEGEGRDIESPLLSPPFSFRSDTRARSGDGRVSCLPIKNIQNLRLFDTSDSIHQRVEKEFIRKRNRRVSGEIPSLWGIWRKRGQKDRYR